MATPITAPAAETPQERTAAQSVKQRFLAVSHLFAPWRYALFASLVFCLMLGSFSPMVFCIIVILCLMANNRYTEEAIAWGLRRGNWQ